jgi:tetratricopeptide (TPR) repeat protein
MEAGLATADPTFAAPLRTVFKFRGGGGCVVIEEMAAFLLLAALLTAAPGALENARDRQDRATLEKQVAELSAAAEKSLRNADAQYKSALAASYLAEIDLELRDKSQAEHAAESGIKAAERAIALEPKNAEYYRVLGTLCGQVIPANVLAAFSYGKRAKDTIKQALELDPKSSKAYLARGIGNYYLPEPLGGGPSVALPDIRKAIELDPNSSEAYLWLGLTLRKAHQNAEARQAFSKSLQLDPDRVWAKQQLEKTPAQ